MPPDALPLHPADRLRRQLEQEYAALYAAARSHWQTTGCTGADISVLFGLHSLIGPQWVREWQADA